ncbi:MAG: Na+/H+ antiporter subunit E [Candidatus Omnitrophica bacterium]|nr:Na+/H+ antiporter subunit E [Candidatus Omnitrophota bacterium]
MRSKVLLFLVSYLSWCLLTWVPDWQHLVVGIFVSAFVVFIIGDLFISGKHLSRYPIRCWYFAACYVPVLIWECIKANFDVAYRVIHPRLPIKPGIVRVKTTLKTDTALTFLANSITLTPGTMSVDIDREKGVLYIHWINIQATDIEGATKTIVKRFEEILGKIFE